MPARNPRPSDGKTQYERFVEMARGLGCEDMDEEAFKAKLAGIVRHKPGPAGDGLQARKPKNS
jgi:hypothetical protein